MRHLVDRFVDLAMGARVGGMAVLLSLGGCATPPKPVEGPTTGLEIRRSGYKYISPLLECEINFGRELRPFQDKVQAYVAERIQRGFASHVSVYFRDLNNGPWFGIAERADFSPASLLKVPLMIAILSEAEKNPSLLSQKLVYDGKEDANASAAIAYPPEKVLDPGRAYAVDDLIYRMIAFSDNNAKVMLRHVIPLVDLIRVYGELGIPWPADPKSENFMTVKQYASCFRILFNATYLDKEMSERALGYLAECRFREGLVAGSPSNVTIAHKFGQRIYEDRKQLHDCGIVYLPGRPYLLAVMTRGDDYDKLTTVIKGVSLLVYEEVSSQNRR